MSIDISTSIKMLLLFSNLFAIFYLQMFNVGVIYSNHNKLLELKQYIDKADNFINLEFAYGTLYKPVDDNNSHCDYEFIGSPTYNIFRIQNMFDYTDKCNRSNDIWDNFTLPNGGVKIGYTPIWIINNYCSAEQQVDLYFMPIFILSILIILNMFTLSVLHFLKSKNIISANLSTLNAVLSITLTLLYIIHIIFCGYNIQKISEKYSNYNEYNGQVISNDLASLFLFYMFLYLRHQGERITRS